MDALELDRFNSSRVLHNGGGSEIILPLVPQIVDARRAVLVNQKQTPAASIQLEILHNKPKEAAVGVGDRGFVASACTSIAHSNYASAVTYHRSGYGLGHPFSARLVLIAVTLKRNG